MSTADPDRDHPFENPLVRYMVGFSGAIVIIVVALVYLEGTAFYAALAIGVADAAFMPKFLDYVAAQDGQT